jgi:hypothetical protein
MGEDFSKRGIVRGTGSGAPVVHNRRMADPPDPVQEERWTITGEANGRPLVVDGPIIEPRDKRIEVVPVAALSRGGWVQLTDEETEYIIAALGNHLARLQGDQRALLEALINRLDRSKLAPLQQEDE